MLNVQRLKVLREVAARGSFSAAAEALSYTQSAVSQAVATLEAETGVTLIERDRRGVRPTAAGAALVEHAEGILAQLEAAEAEVAAIAGSPGRPAADGLVPDRRRDADAARDRDLPRRPPRRRAEPRRGRAGGDRAAAARRRVRSRAAVRVPWRQREARAGLRRFDLLEDPMRLALPQRAPPGGQADRAARGPERGVVGADLRGERPARATSSAPATPRASSRESRSRATTTRPSRAWSRRASAWP